VFSVVFLVVMLSSIALPGTNGFVGEFLVLLGAFQTQRTWAIIAATGVILSAAYMLWMYQRVVFGPVTNAENSLLKDLSPREVAVFVPLLVLIFWMGLFPNPILSRLQPTVERGIAQIESRRLHLREAEARQRMSQAGVEPCCPEHGAASMVKR
jgi:NADH-quinone oxidoreductase subunit M